MLANAGREHLRPRRVLIEFDLEAVQQLGDLFSVLALGETATLEYWTTYRYPGDPLDQHEREYRRAVMRQMENFDMRVEFHPQLLPAAVWWASWDGMDGDITEQEKVTLDSQHSAHRYLRLVSKTVVGFHWSW